MAGAQVGGQRNADRPLLRGDAAESIAALRPQFVALAHVLKLHDLDTAAVKDGRPRALTQSVATYLHATTEIDGVTFASRHGDDLALYSRGGSRLADFGVVDLVAYLEQNLSYASTFPDVGFGDFARDVRLCVTHMEQDLHAGEQIETGAPCQQCAERSR